VDCDSGEVFRAVLVEYAYDNASRLTGITYKQNGTTLLGDLSYEYDKNGNRTKTGGSFARTGLPQAVASTAYNAANHQTTFDNKTLTYDNNGSLLTSTDPGGMTTYTWNARNQLTGISGPSVSATFDYDGLGRREKKTINSNVTEFLYDRLNPVQETSGATILANILPGLGIDEFLTRTDVVAGVTSSFLTDALGSPVAVTNSSGVVQTEYTYEPFGKTTVSGTTNSSSYQYTGRENDGTGLYYYRARFYNPQLQRFISEDPHPGFQTLSQSLNKYSYVMNDATDYVDPLGLTRKDPEPPGCPPTGCPPPMCPPAGCMPPECPLGVKNCMRPDPKPRPKPEPPAPPVPPPWHPLAQRGQPLKQWNDPNLPLNAPNRETVPATGQTMGGNVYFPDGWTPGAWSPAGGSIPHGNNEQ
jgi:RHS repeat-associated protein